MPPADFWNLAGRAGRWGKEFQGNVICVDTQDKIAWGDTLPGSRGKYRVERTTDRLLKDETRLIDYINAGAPSLQANSGQDLETAVSYFSTVRNKYGSLMGAPWQSRVGADALAHVDASLGTALAALDTMPEQWLRRHAGISPFAMARMMAALTKLQGPIDPFLPVDPEFEDAAKQYARIFQLMGHHMTSAFGWGARCVALGILTTNWMLGHPIKRLIADRLKNKRKRGKPEEVAKTIRDTLEDVEQIARFQAPRYLACYSDIVRHVLQQKGMADTIGAIPDLTLPLEFGVRGPVQLALMSLGLSRSSTLAISDTVLSALSAEEIARAATEPALVAAAVRRLSPASLGLSELIATEVANLQQILGGAEPLEPK